MVNTRSLFHEMINVIENKQYNGDNVYKFQEIKLYGITFLYEIYLKEKIFVIKCKNIFVLFDKDNEYYGRYILHHKKYDNLNDLLLHISTIPSQYKIYNGILLKQQDINHKKIEMKILNCENNTHCSICFECTDETTICNHYICLKCRETMISKSQFNCPLCRNENIIQYFSNDTNNIYNLLYNELNFINNNEILHTTYGSQRNLIINQHIHHIDIPTIMNLIIIREIITNTTSYPIVFTIHLFTFITSYKMRVFFTLFLLFTSLYSYFYSRDFNHYDEYFLENNKYNNITIQ